MEFRIAETFQKSLGKLTNQEQKVVKAKAFDIQLDITGNATQFHRLDRTKDNNFWSVRVNTDIRIIAHKAGKSVMLTYVDHHDRAYKWAANRVIRKHPVTGAAQIVSVKEADSETFTPSKTEPQESRLPLIFSDIPEQSLRLIGVPEEYIDHVKKCDENHFFKLMDILPSEATEKLLEYASEDISLDDLNEKSLEYDNLNRAVPDEYGLNHPDAKRRFALVNDEEELAAALEFPWHQWTVFLHPDQRKYSELDYSGAARVSGSAGTGKTIVALHRAAYLAKANPKNKILLCTFTKTLAAALKLKLEILFTNNQNALQQIEVTHFEGLAFNSLKRQEKQPNIASKIQIENFFRRAREESLICKYPIGFLLSEWENVIDAWGIETLSDYLDINRVGRKSKLGSTQRSEIWPVFAAVKKFLNGRNLTTWSTIFRNLNIKNDPFLNFEHVIVDEAQDISVAELGFLSRNFSKKPNGLLFAGDMGQRIFRSPFSWMSLGVDVRGKSYTLTVNYRTSHEIRKQAEQLLPTTLKDQDLNNENITRTISLFRGQPPKIVLKDNEAEEEIVVSDWIIEQIKNGVKPAEIGIFVRSEKQYFRVNRAIKKSGNTSVVLNYKNDGDESSVNYGTMHLAKGLEFRSVAIMACDADQLPLRERIEIFSEDSDLDEVERSERQLLYVACTRARERLLVSGVGVGSKYLYDLA